MDGIISLFSSRGRNEEFETLLSPYLKGLYRLAYRLSGQRQDAEDLVQDLLTKLYPRWYELREVENLRTWLARVLYNLHIDAIRKRQRSPLDHAEEIHDDLFGDVMSQPVQHPEQHVEQVLLQRRLQLAVSNLTADQRTVLSLHDMEGYTLLELTHVLDTPIGTLKSRLHRARKALREQLVKEPFAASERVNG